MARARTGRDRRDGTPAPVVLSLLVGLKGAHQSPELEGLALVTPIVGPDARARPTGRDWPPRCWSRQTDARDPVVPWHLRPSGPDDPSVAVTSPQPRSQEVDVCTGDLHVGQEDGGDEAAESTGGQQRSVSIGYALPGTRAEKDPGGQLHPVTSLPGRLGQVQAHRAQGSKKAP